MDSVIYPRRILLCATGLTPQVVTETLYALYKTNCQTMPTEVHLITTAHGRNRVIRDLLDAVDGKFHQFCSEFNLENQILFDSSHVHVIKGRYDEELSDIRTPQENECAADCIMALVKEFCSDPHSQVHVSIAGGRKGMGFLIGYALSIFGRDQDRLSHVLTSEPFENNRDFFYPSAIDGLIYAVDGSPLDPLQARISLAEIPFIRLRNGLSSDLFNTSVSFSETIEWAQKQVAPTIGLTFHLLSKKVTVGQKDIDLSSVLFCTYYWFASLHKTGKLPLQPGVDIAAEDFHQLCRQVLPKYSATLENIQKATKTGEDFKQYFQEKRSKINRMIEAQLGKDRAKPYLIESNRKRLNIKYGMAIAPDMIFIKKD